MTIRKQPALIALSIALICYLIAPLAAAQEPRASARLIGAPSPIADTAWVGLELSPQAGWHTYWQNPGDAGLATRLRWTTPDNVSVSDILWPTPTAYREGDLLTYGFGSTHTLLARVTLPADVSDTSTLQLKARWLVCKDICIPESADLSLSVGQIRNANAAWRNAITAATQALPEDLGIQGQFATIDDKVQAFIPLPPNWYEKASALEWFPALADAVDHAGTVTWAHNAEGLMVSNLRHRDYANPSAIQGVLVIQDPQAKRAIQVSLTPGAMPNDLAPLQLGDQKGEMAWWLAIVMAFAGGLILNLMPCVFPVLALKALSLTRAESARARRLESLAYSGGVVLSFLAIAQVLLLLRAGGAALGWGFQLQNPVIVGVLAVLMLIMGLAMLGWTQIGMGFMGWGQNLTAHSGMRGAFFTGVLAVVVASPCSAPFMGGALGYAVLQPAPIALSIFTALGLGLAAPFVAIAWIPALAKRLPKPGAWMETLKHWMAVPLFLTGVWLLWVLWRQAGTAALALVIFGSVLIAIAIRQTPQGRILPKPVTRLLGTLGLALIFAPLMLPAQTSQQAVDAAWQPWSEQAVAQGRQEHRLILVDFTADWCLSCIVNERAVLASSEIQDKLQEHNALLLKADWTQYDPAITAALAQFGRNGVPLYLLYPISGGEPEVLPQILTKPLVRKAIARALE